MALSIQLVFDTADPARLAPVRPRPEAFLARIVAPDRAAGAARAPPQAAGVGRHRDELEGRSSVEAAEFGHSSAWSGVQTPFSRGRSGCRSQRARLPRHRGAP